MRPPDEVRKDLVGQWLAKAEADLAAARHLGAADAGFAAAAGFHAQQAAEKFMKALLSWRQVEFPKTHDLEALIDLIERGDPNLADSLRGVTPLNDYAVGHRYPGEFPEPTAEDAALAIALATMVRDKVLAALPETPRS